MTAAVAGRKTRISALLLGLFPGLWECFEDPWNHRARWVYRHRLNPFRLAKLSPSRLDEVFRRVTPNSYYTVIKRESTALLATARGLAAVYQPALCEGLVTDAWFQTWQQEISKELDLIEAEEAQITRLDEEIGELYKLLHPQNHLRTIPGVGPRVAPLLLAAV